MPIKTQEWSGWRQTLAQAVSAGKQSGMDDGEIVKRAEAVGDFLATNVDPQNPEQSILKEMWEAADDSQQQQLAEVLINVVSKQK